VITAPCRNASRPGKPDFAQNAPKSPQNPPGSPCPEKSGQKHDFLPTVEIPMTKKPTFCPLWKFQGPKTRLFAYRQNSDDPKDDLSRTAKTAAAFPAFRGGC
jgi:hypothetical protein